MTQFQINPLKCSAKSSVISIIFADLISALLSYTNYRLTAKDHIKAIYFLNTIENCSSPCKKNDSLSSLVDGNIYRIIKFIA